MGDLRIRDVVSGVSCLFRTLVPSEVSVFDPIMVIVVAVRIVVFHGSVQNVVGGDGNTDRVVLPVRRCTYLSWKV